MGQDKVDRDTRRRWRLMPLGVVVALVASAALVLGPMSAPAAGAATPPTITTTSASTGVPALDSILVSLESEIAAAGASVNGVVANAQGTVTTVEGELSGVLGLLIALGPAIQCLPNTILVQLHQALPTCQF